MSRSAGDLLEFDRLREIVRGFATCAPGRRAIEALAPSRIAPTSPLISRLSAKRSNGSAAAAISVSARSPIPSLGSRTSNQATSRQPPHPLPYLAPAELLDAASLLDTSAWLRQYFHRRGKIQALPRPSLPHRIARRFPLSLHRHPSRRHARRQHQ